MQKIIKSSLFVLVLILLFSNIVSAVGLNIVEGNNQNISKLSNENKNISFTIINDASYNFYNVSFETSNVLFFNTIGQINAGQNITINAKINTNNNFDGNIRIKGLQESDIGIQNKTYAIGVDFTNGLSECDKTLIVGDRIKWINQVSSEIKLRNAQTNSIVTTIPQGGEYIINFDNTQTFDYYFERIGFKFTDTCRVTIISSQGFVNRAEDDAILNFKLLITYLPTSLSTTISNINYTLDPFSSEDGVITIVNIGNNTAKNITLENSWITFNKNNFDLDVGKTTAVIYTVKPIVFATSDTNKFYNRILTIKSSNVETTNISIGVFVNYAEVNPVENTTGVPFIDIIKAYCESHPDDPQVCAGNRTVFITVNNGTEDFNVTYNTEQLRDLQQYQFEKDDRDKDFQQNILEQNDNTTTRVTNLDNRVDNIDQNFEEFVDYIKSKDNNTNNVIVVVLFVFVAILSIGVLFMAYKLKKSDEYSRM